MIERCSYCGLEHDVGSGETYFGSVIKTCPMMPLDEIRLVALPDTKDEDFFDQDMVMDA